MESVVSKKEMPMGTEKKPSDMMTKFSSTKMEPFQESWEKMLCYRRESNQYNTRKGDFTYKKCHVGSKESKRRV